MTLFSKYLKDKQNVLDEEAKRTKKAFEKVAPFVAKSPDVEWFIPQDNPRHIFITGDYAFFYRESQPVAKQLNPYSGAQEYESDAISCRRTCPACNTVVHTRLYLGVDIKRFADMEQVYETRCGRCRKTHTEALEAGVINE